MFLFGGGGGGGRGGEGGGHNKVPDRLDDAVLCCDIAEIS